MRGFKAASTSKIRKQQAGVPGVWQRNYYERVIRSEAALRRIREYIVENPRLWEEDMFYVNLGRALRSPPERE